MSYTRCRATQPGAFASGLAGAGMGYRLYNADGSANGARVTAGVAEIGATTIYIASVTHPDDFQGAIVFDDGAGNTAVETINPGTEYADVKTSTRNSGNVTVAGFVANAITAAAINAGAITNAKFAADAIDANALKADAVSEIAAGILATPANLLVTDATGRVNLNLAQALDQTAVGATVGGSLFAGWVSNFGKRILDKVAKTLTYFRSDNVTVGKVVTLDSATVPTQVTP